MNSNFREEWRPVAGFDGIFDVSSFGRIRSRARRIVRSNGWPQTFLGRARATPQNESGYPAFAAQCKGRKGKTMTVHRIVARAYLGRRPAGMDVRHLDGVKTNNRVWNLAYGTRKENMDDNLRHGKRNRGERCGLAKLTQAKADFIRGMVAAGTSQARVATRFGISQPQVSAIVHRKYWAWGDDERRV